MRRLVGGRGYGIHHQCGAEQIEHVAFVSRKGMRFTFAAMAHVTIAQGGLTITRRAPAQPSTAPRWVGLQILSHDPGDVCQRITQWRLLGRLPAVLLHPPHQRFCLLYQPLQALLACLWVIPVPGEGRFQACVSQ